MVEESECKVCKSLDAAADPGFPVGGARPVAGGTDLQRGHFLAEMYVKTKELGPVGRRGGLWRHPLESASEMASYT